MFKVNKKGLNKLIKWGLPILGLVVASVPGCIFGLILSCVIAVDTTEEEKEKK